jgi:hypothetical protein
MNIAFPLQLAIALVSTIALAWYPLAVYANENIISSAQIGAILMTLNALAGYLTIEKSFLRENSVFYKYVFGGMIARMFFLCAIFFLIIKLFRIDTTALIASMFFYYVVYTVLEIQYIQKKHSVQQNISS